MTEEKDHSQFMVSLVARITTFFNEMTQFCLKDFNRLAKKSDDVSEDESSLSSEQKKSEGEQKRKYNKARTRLIIEGDSERPKAPTSSFLLYYHENKVMLAKKFGETNVSKLTKLASQQWKNLPEDQRQVYQKMSQESKDRYQKQMAEYKSKYADQIEIALKKRRAQYRNTWMIKKKAMKAKEQRDSETSSLNFTEDDRQEFD